MKRLDLVLVERGICVSREKAKCAIMAGQVRVNEQVARKASDAIAPDDTVVLLQPEKYVSRGGYKLEHALQEFHMEVTNLTAVDLGASTGGFTDCLLQQGARNVCAVDVGRGQLAWSLRHHPRVVVMEQTNARFLTPQSFPPGVIPVDLVTIDCSFISLQKLLPSAARLVKPGSRIVALVKPQFEAGKTEADEGEGVITDPAIHQRVLDELRAFVDGLGTLRWVNLTTSPLLGPAGNKEFLLLLENIG